MYGTRAPIDPSLVPATKKEQAELKSFRYGNGVEEVSDSSAAKPISASSCDDESLSE